ncbi:MAG: efflux RND transporter periplasmic adaptor subunit [Vicinamibacterales bacterium]
MKRLLWGTALFAIAALAAAYWIRVDVSAAPAELAMAAVSRGDVVATVEATGTLQPLDTVEVGTQVSGIIASLGTDFNQIVKRGQIIATLDQAIFQSQVDQARATTIRLTSDVDQAQVQLEDAQLKLKRAEQLAAEQLLAQQDVDTARSAARVAEAGLVGAKAQLSQAEAALTQAKVNLSHTVIAAPSDGIVLSRNVEVGQTVSAGLQAPILFVIARDLTRLELQARVDESDVGGVEPGAPVVFTVDAYPRREFTGTVRLVRLQPQTVQNVVTYTTVIDVPNPGGELRPGMTSTVSIETARADEALRVPVAALRFQPTEDILKQFPADTVAGEGEARRAAVWQLAGGRLRQVPVGTGVSDGTQVAISTDAFGEGAQVVTGIVRATGAATAAAPASGSPLLPSMPRRPQSTGGGSPQGRQ